MPGITLAAGKGSTRSDHDQYPVLSWWHILLLIGVPLGFGAILFLVYCSRFPGGLSDQQGVWGQFGDFFGGTLNPVIALATLIAVAASLRYTIHALELSHKQFKNELTEQQRRRRRDRKTEQEERTFRMHQVWIDPIMQERRVESQLSNAITTQIHPRAHSSQSVQG
jgi:hypothetical protein